MDKPINTAPGGLSSPTPATAALWSPAAVRLSGVALRWSAHAVLPTVRPGWVGVPSSVVVRINAPKAGR